MLSYILRRILATLPVMAIVALFVFSLLYIAPGDPAAVIAGDQASPADVERIRQGLGLDRPFLIQFGVIALVLAILLRSAGAILIFTIVGVIVHVIVDVVMPMVRGGGMGDFDFGAFAGNFTDVTYLKYLGALAIAYFFGILILGGIKGMLFRGD